MMMNYVPVILVLKLNTPFEFVQNATPYSKTWFELYSIGYFNHHINNTASRYKLQAHTLDGLAVVRDDKSNSIIFNKPFTSSYYCLPDYHQDESRLPINNLPNTLCLDGGLSCGLL